MRRFNHRTHRKILVVDGEVGFTGGVGIAHQRTGDARGPQEWHDTHYRLTGPVVEPLRDAFFRNWCGPGHPPVDARNSGGTAADSVTGEGKTSAAPDSRNRGSTGAVVSVSSPERGHENSYAAFRHAIEAARERLWIMTAYFVPDLQTRRILCRAALRGVEVQVMVPGAHLDHQVARFASRAQWGELLECGVGICVYERTMLHAKSLLVDDHRLSQLRQPVLQAQRRAEPACF